MLRQLAGVVMIEIAQRCARLDQPQYICPILIMRDIEHGDVIASHRVDTLQQLDVALDAGYQHRALQHLRLGQPQLLQCAQAICIAVESVVTGHASTPAAIKWVTISSAACSGDWVVVSTRISGASGGS